MFGSRSKEKGDKYINLQKLDKKEVKYVTKREKGSSEIVIGKNGIINIVNDEISIISANDIILRKKIADIDIAELMSLNGVVITHKDKDAGETEVFTAYYKYHR